MNPYRLILTLIVIASFCPSMPVAATDGSRERLVDSAEREVRQWEVTGPWGGDVRSMVVSPDNSDLLYLGTSDGQIYRSTDGASTWRRLRPGLRLRGLSVEEIIIDPRDPRVIYAGTWAVARDQEGGVFRSEDGGENWKLLSETKNLSVRSLAIAPSDSNVLVAGTANDDMNLNGVFRTTNGGKDWARISPLGDKEIRNIESVAIDPRNPDFIYVGTWHLAWKTTDGGVAWKQSGDAHTGVLDDSDIFGITVLPDNPDVVYMNACSGMYRSVNAGAKWSKLPGVPFSARRTYVLRPHPSKPNILFAGTSEGLWRSKDGGKRWMLLTSKTVVIRAVVISPDKPDRVLIATDDFGVRISESLGDDFQDANTGFIHRHVLSIMPDASERGRLFASVFHDGNSGSLFVSNDGGENWLSSSRGLGTRDVFALYQMPDDPNRIYAGTNTGVFRSNDRGESWSFVGLEKPVKPAVKKPARRPARKPPARSTRRRASLDSVNTPSIGGVGRYEIVPTSMSFAPAQRGKKKPAKRKPTQKKTTPRRTVKKPAPEVPAGPPMFELTRQVDDITSFTDSEGRSGLMAATMVGIFRTYDESKGWEKVHINGYDPEGRVFSIATHKDKPQRIFAGTRLGLYVSNDGGQTWDLFERGPNDVSVKSIAMNPVDPDMLLVGTNHYIFRSTNGGRTWVRRGGGLPSGDFTSVVFNPIDPDEVIVAEYSKGGVYRSVDKGYTWERLDELGGAELPTTRVWTLTFDPFDKGRIYAGSFSSGVYVLTIQRGARTGTQ
jgi:photosystem II stability/assembly factor-like uncharacterized protein